MENFGHRIREYRIRQSLTQGRLAEYLGVTDQAVSKWERGTAMPDIALLPPLTRIFGCTADELLGISRTTDQAKEFAERVDRIFRENWPGKFPPTFDTKKLADEKLKSGINLDYVTDEAIRSWIPMVKNDDERGGEQRTITYTSGHDTFRELLRRRALAGDQNALDLLLGIKSNVSYRAMQYERAYALCQILGATEIVDVRCGNDPHFGGMLTRDGFRYTGLCANGSAERFNRLLTPFVAGVSFRKAAYPCEIETGEGAMGFAFQFPIRQEEAEDLMSALARDFDRVIVQVWDNYETAFRKAFDGFSMRVLTEEEFYGRYTGTFRRRKTVFFATKIRDDVSLLDSLRYDWYDTRFICSADDRWRTEYYRRWDGNKRTTQTPYEPLNEWLRDEAIFSVELSAEEEAIVRRAVKRQEEIPTFLGVVEKTGDGYVLSFHYVGDTSDVTFPERDGSRDYMLGEGYAECEGHHYYIAALIRDGLLRTVEAILLPDGMEKPDRPIWYWNTVVEWRDRVLPGLMSE